MNSESELDRIQVQPLQRITTINMPNSPTPKLGFHCLLFLIMALFAIVLAHSPTLLSFEEYNLFTQLSIRDTFMNRAIVISFSIIFLVFLATLYFISRPRKVYLVNFACYKPGPTQICSKEKLVSHVLGGCGRFTEESIGFAKKILERSGLGDKTYFPKSLLKFPPTKSMAGAREEAESVIFGAIDEVLEKTGIMAGDIRILVLNSSLFNPIPSLSAMIVNRYKLGDNILSFNLAGMGCSAGLISIHLVQQLLQVHPKCYALVVSTENITHGSYLGNNRSMLLSNCLFRVGGAAILLSNHSSDRHHSKYELVHMLRTHEGANDRSYKSVFQQDDEQGLVGVTLSKDILFAAGEALKKNITTLSPLVLPLSEQLYFLANLLARSFFKKKVKPYIPNFKLAFEHFCVHAGGRAVLDELQKRLELTDWLMEPSKMTLYRFGNTSSSTIWYELAYSEAKGRVNKGDRIWQIGLGSGFKCNSVVWRALRNINPTIEKNPWMDEINDFPVHVPKVETFSN